MNNIPKMFENALKRQKFQKDVKMAQKNWLLETCVYFKHIYILENVNDIKHTKNKEANTSKF